MSLPAALAAQNVTGEHRTILAVRNGNVDHDVDSPVTLVFNFAQPGVATDSYTTESDPTLEHPRHLDSQGSGMTF